MAKLNAKINATNKNALNISIHDLHGFEAEENFR